MERTRRLVGLKNKTSVFNVATLLIATAIFGQLLGFLRTKLVNSHFPPTGPNSTDAYFAAFTIPDLFFYTISAGALGVAFMPVLSDYLKNHGRRAVWEITASLLNLLLIFMVVVAIVILIFAKPLMHYIVAPGLGPVQLNHATDIMRLLALNPLLFTISGVLTAVQQTFGRFFFYAIAPIFYNLSIIASIYVFKSHFGIVGLGVGALIGAILQLIIVIIGLSHTNFYWKPHINFKNKDFRLILKNLPPRSVDQGMDQIEDIVETHLASSLGSGNISYYNNAFTLSTAPILLIGTAISTAAFPRLNARLSQNRPDLFRKDFLRILKAMIWIALPVVILAYFCRGYLARLIFDRGNDQIAIIFGFLSIAIFSQIIYSIVSRWFYSQKDTRTPFYVSIFTISFNIILAVILSKPSAYGVAGLAIAQSIVATTEVIILMTIMVIKDNKLLDAQFFIELLKLLAVSGFTALTAFIMISLLPLGLFDKGIITLGSKLAAIFLVSFIIHILVSALFDLEEVQPVLKMLRKVVLKPIKIDLS